MTRSADDFMAPLGGISRPPSPPRQDCCETCEFSRPTLTPQLSCRRQAPAGHDMWPNVDPTDWCAEFSLSYAERRRRGPPPSPPPPSSSRPRDGRNGWDAASLIVLIVLTLAVAAALAAGGA